MCACPLFPQVACGVAEGRSKNARSIRSSPPANLVPLIPRAKEESLVGGLANVNPPADKPGAPMI